MWAGIEGSGHVLENGNEEIICTPIELLTAVLPVDSMEKPIKLSNSYYSMQTQTHKHGGSYFVPYDFANFGLNDA